MGAVKQSTTKLNKWHKTHQQPEGRGEATEGGDRAQYPSNHTGTSMPFMMTKLLCLIALLFAGLLITFLSYSYSDLSSTQKQQQYLYWGYRIDCPGKHCDTCAGLGHQESSLRCALEEALVLGRYPSFSCLVPFNVAHCWPSGLFLSFLRYIAHSHPHN